MRPFIHNSSSIRDDPSVTEDYVQDQMNALCNKFEKYKEMIKKILFVSSAQVKVLSLFICFQQKIQTKQSFCVSLWMT